MLRQLLVSSLVPLSNLSLAALPFIASITPASKYDRLETGSVMVETELSYLEDVENQFLTNFKVRITRDKSTIVDAALPVELLPDYEKGSGVNRSIPVLGS